MEDLAAEDGREEGGEEEDRGELHVGLVTYLIVAWRIFPDEFLKGWGIVV